MKKYPGLERFGLARIEEKVLTPKLYFKEGDSYRVLSGAEMKEREEKLAKKRDEAERISRFKALMAKAKANGMEWKVLKLIKDDGREESEVQGNNFSSQYIRSLEEELDKSIEERNLRRSVQRAFFGVMSKMRDGSLAASIAASRVVDQGSGLDSEVGELKEDGTEELDLANCLLRLGDGLPLKAGVGSPDRSLSSGGVSSSAGDVFEGASAVASSVAPSAAAAAAASAGAAPRGALATVSSVAPRPAAASSAAEVAAKGVSAAASSAAASAAVSAAAAARALPRSAARNSLGAASASLAARSLQNSQEFLGALNRGPSSSFQRARGQLPSGVGVACDQGNYSGFGSLPPLYELHDKAPGSNPQITGTKAVDVRSNIAAIINAFEEEKKTRDPQGYVPLEDRVVRILKEGGKGREK